jgi:hypothetical protein
MVRGREHPAHPRQRRSIERCPSLYDKLEDAVIPMFYSDRTRFIDVMLHSIAINGSFFQYATNGPSVCAKGIFHLIGEYD